MANQSEQPQANLAHFYRYIWEEPNVLVVFGEGEEIIKGYEAYNARYGIEPEPDEAACLNLKRLFIGISLANIALAERESWGFSITPQGSRLGYFVASEAEGMVTGIVQPAQRSKNLAVVQRQKPGEDPTTSTYEPTDTNIVDGLANYFDRSDQVKTRLAVDGDYTGALFRLMPKGDFSAIEGLSDTEVIGLAKELVETKKEQLKPVGEVLAFYLCRCDESMIRDMLSKLSQEQQEEIWGDEASIEVQCPRCGRKYELNR